MQQEKKIYRKANLVYEDCDIKPGHTIRLYGEETIVKGFHVSYNDALGRWETIILTEGRGDPFERTLVDIEVLEDQPDESTSKEGNKEQVVNPLAFHKWMIETGWKEHSSGRYYYRSKDYHQWPPDETCEESELLDKYNQQKEGMK